eukprot:967773-Prorocentrum_minimum.AAC.1
MDGRIRFRCTQQRSDSPPLHSATVGFTSAARSDGRIHFRCTHGRSDSLPLHAWTVGFTSAGATPPPPERGAR